MISLTKILSVKTFQYLNPLNCGKCFLQGRYPRKRRKSLQSLQCGICLRLFSLCPIYYTLYNYHILPIVTFYQDITYYYTQSNTGDNDPGYNFPMENILLQTKPNQTTPMEKPLLIGNKIEQPCFFEYFNLLSNYSKSYAFWELFCLSAIYTCILKKKRASTTFYYV